MRALVLFIGIMLLLTVIPQAAFCTEPVRIGYSKVFLTETGPLQILNNVTLSIAEGGFLCILGASGTFRVNNPQH